jgi:photosystem II stability/assembly factor-like uncharacterized protein
MELSFRMRVILIFGVMAAVVAVSYWYMQMTTGMVEEKVKKELRLRDGLLGVSFCDDKNGWAVGQYGTILHSTDGGVAWNYQRSGVRSHIIAVHGISPEVAWAVGHGGIVIHTSDTGKTWKVVNMGMQHVFNDVQFVNPQEGWIVGQYETILHTGDGGNNWQRVHGGEPAAIDFSKVKEGEIVDENFGAEEEVYTLNSVYFLNNQLGWAAGEAGIILKTTNGGKTWEKLVSGTKNTLTDIEFNTQDFGFVVGLDSTILKTIDGGKTWSQERPTVRTHYYGVTFRRYGPEIVRNDAFAVGQGAIAYYSYLKKPYLQNWMPPTETKFNFNYYWLYKVSFITKSGEEAIIIGEDGLLLRTPSGGHVWENVEYPDKPVDFVINP